MTASPPLSLAEWVVLVLVTERPTHGFPIAQLTAHEGVIVVTGSIFLVGETMSVLGLNP